MKTMKTKIWMIATLAMMMVACTEKTVSFDTPYIIEGELTGVRDGVEIRLYMSDTGGSTKLDTDTIMGGKFRFEQVMQEPEQNKLYLLVLDEDFPRMLCHIYTTPGASIKVIGKDTHIATWDVQSDVPEQLVHNEILGAAKAEYEEAQTLTLSLDEKKSELRSIDREAQHELYNTKRDEYNALVDRYNSLPTIMQQKKIEQMKKMKPSAVWLSQLNEIALSAGSDDEYPYRDDAIILYEMMSEDMKQTEEGKEIYANLYPPKQIKEGDVCPDADFFDLEGNLHHLSEFKGKYMLLDFWSLGCGYCILAFPEMKQMHEQYADKLAIVSLSIDKDARWRRASEEHQLTWSNWNEGKGMGGISVNFRVFTIPHYVLVNPEGIVEKMLVGYEDGMFKKLFSELFED